MLFARRTPETRAERLRLWLWPRRSIGRSLRYFVKRVLRLNATPHAVAAGVAAGIFASFFPLGLHFFIAMAVAWLISGNLISAAIATAFGNPLTMPLLWGASYEAGLLMLGRAGVERPGSIAEMLHHLGFAELWEPVLKPMLVGAVPLGIAAGFVFYAFTRWGMARFERQRRARMAERRSHHEMAEAQ